MNSSLPDNVIIVTGSASDPEWAVARLAAAPGAIG